MIDAIPRRTFLGISVATTAMVASAGTPALALTKGPRLIGIDTRLTTEELQGAFVPTASTATKLPVEIVGTWRRELGKQVVRSRGLDAYTRWDLALVLAGLGREHGLKIDQRQLSPSTFLTRMSGW